jgi:hypothetical protein
MFMIIRAWVDPRKAEWGTPLNFLKSFIILTKKYSIF